MTALRALITMALTIFLAAATPEPAAQQWVLVPRERPRDATALRHAVGVFEGYEVEMAPIAMMLLRVRDAGALTVHQYLLAAATTLDGQPLRCGTTRTVGDLAFCQSFPPQIVAGKTVLSLVYWEVVFPDTPVYRATDTIVTVRN